MNTVKESSYKSIFGDMDSAANNILKAVKGLYALSQWARNITPNMVESWPMMYSNDTIADSIAVYAEYLHTEHQMLLDSIKEIKEAVSKS